MTKFRTRKNGKHYPITEKKISKKYNVPNIHLIQNKYFSEEELRKYWANGKIIKYKGKNYTVHKMSYGDYFLEPEGWTGGETEGFAPKTIWLEKTTIKNQYGTIMPVYIEEE